MSTRPKSKRPLSVIITAAFLAYAGLIPLPHMLMQGQTVSIYSQLLIGLTLVACVSLLLPGRSRLVFNLTRVVLACWVISALIALREIMVSPPVATTVHASSGPPPSQVVLLAGALAVLSLFYFFSFGHTSRVYYRLRTDSESDQG